MPVLFTNNASTTLSAGINNSTTTVPIASASGFPSIGSGEYYFATIANTNNTKIEVVKVTAGTTSLTVTRAQDGTSAQAFDSGDNFQLRVTAATLDATSKSDVAITAGSVSADTLIAKGDGSSADGQIQLNCSQNSHGIKLKSPPHSAGADYTLTFPNDDGDANQYLQTNGSGVLDWNTVDLTALSASNLTSGTVPAARITASSIANDLIDSQHYADGSIDTAHIGDDQVTADKLANSINTEIAANTAKVTNATHTGDVTGATELTIASGAVETGMIADDAVTAAKLANSINTEIAANTAKVTNATHTGDVTGATALTIAADAVTTAKIADDSVTADKLANSINTDIATGVTANTTANAALPKSGGAMTGAITTNSTFDGVDIATRDAVLTSTTTTANAALPKAGGTITGTVTVSANAVGTVTTDNDGSFSMSATNNFKCTPTGNFTLTFTNIVAQSGNILLVNSGGHTVAAHANTKVDANLLATVSTAGTYLLSYFSDGTNVYMTNSAIYT